MKNTKTESEYLYIVKAIAISSVVCAHCGNVPANSTVLNQVLSSLFGYWGTAGVPVFYFLSGYFFEKNSKSWTCFWKAKFKTIVVPWVSCATMVWLYVVLRKGGITIASWFNFIVGNGSSLYYITVLLILYLVLFYLKRNKVICWILVCVSVIGIILAGEGYVWGRNTVSIYLNPIYWMGYFILGILIQKHSWMDRIRKFSNKSFLYMLVIWGSLCTVHYLGKIEWTYWSRYALFNIATEFIVIIGLAEQINRARIMAHMVEVGKESYSIYLLHQLFVGIVVNISNYINWSILTILRPILIIESLHILLTYIKSKDTRCAIVLRKIIWMRG